MGNLPPGPSAPALVQVYRYTRDPLPLFEECGRRFGDIFTLNLGRMGRWVFVSSPQLVKVLYDAESDDIRAGAPKARIFGPVVGHTSSLVLDGAPHVQRRHMLQTAFRGERMLASTELIASATRKNIAAWPRGQDFSAHRQLQALAFDAVITGIFGRGMPAAVAAQLRQLMTHAVASKLLFMPFLQRDLGPWSPWGRLKRVVRETDAVLYAEIARRRQCVDEDDDILGLLLQARTEQGQPLSDLDVRDELVTMVVAGNEITGLSLAWSLVSLLSHPETYRRARDEVRSTLGERPVDRTQVGGLTYLGAAIRESLRLHSAVANGSLRQLRVPQEMGGYALPAGTLVNVCIHLLHHRPDLYPEPRAFNPERFVGKKVSPYEWVPFGGGVRRCLGMAFALHEMKVVLATLLQTVELSLAQGAVRARRHGQFMKPLGGPRVHAAEPSPPLPSAP